MTMDYRTSHIGEKKAKSYDSLFYDNPYRAMMWDLEREVLNTAVEKYAGGKIGEYLDFACGSGRVLSHLSPKASKATGVDVSEDMMAIALDVCPNCELIKLDITRKNFKGDRSFKLITAFRFFPNAQDELRIEAMKSLVKLLAPGGHIIFNNHKNSTSLIYQITKLPGFNKRQSMSSNEVESLIDAAGLEIVDTYHVGVVPSTDKYRLLPRKILTYVERVLSRFPIMQTMSSNVIYVCSHR